MKRLLFLLALLILLSNACANQGQKLLASGENGTESVGGSSADSGSGSNANGDSGGRITTSVPVAADFTVDKTTLKVVLKQGQTKTENLSIKNTGTTIFDIKALLQELGDFKVFPELNEAVATLQPNEEKTINFTFKASENKKPDVYTGRITLKSPSVEKEINTIIELESAEPLFDVDIEVLPDSKKILAGKELLLDVNLFNIRGFGRVDVGVEYIIKDFKGNIVAAEHETLAVETQVKFSRALLVPSDLRPGTYAVFAKVAYADSVGTSSAIFEVNAKEIRMYSKQIEDYRPILLFGAAVLIAGISIYLYRSSYLKKLPKSKGEEAKQWKEESKIQKFEKELKALESGYKSGFISEESYKRDKERIEDKLNKLKNSLK